MKTRILVAAIATALTTAPAFATNGYFQHGYGSKSSGMAGAGSVYSKEALVGATNPASISMAGDRVDLGFQLFMPDRSASTNAFAAGGAGTYSLNEEDLFLVPEFGYSKKLNEDVTAALLLYGNGGMNTKSDRPLYSTNGIKTGVDMSQLFIAPTISWDINEDNNIGVSLNLAVQRFKAYGINQFNGYTPTGQAGGTSTHLTDNGYDYSFGAGLSIGWTGEVSDRLTLGAAYKSRTYMEEFDKYSELFAEQGDFDIAANWTIGLAYQATPKLAIAFDIQHIYFSDVNSIGNPNNNVAAQTQLGWDNGKGFGWDDMTIFKLGFEYKANDDLVLRAGFSHGDQPIPNTETDFNVLAPAVIEDHATVGFTYTLDDGDEVTGYYMHAFENTLNASGTGGAQFTNWIKMSQDAVGIAYTWKLN